MQMLKLELIEIIELFWHLYVLPNNIPSYFSELLYISTCTSFPQLNIQTFFSDKSKSFINKHQVGVER